MVVITDMSFKAGQEFKISGKAKTSTSFSMNIGHNDDNIALHFNPRFDEHGDQKIILCNSRQGGSWMEEIRETNFPFNSDEEFKITITFDNDAFYIKLPDGYMLHFPNRFGDDKFKYMAFWGDVKIHSVKIK